MDILDRITELLGGKEQQELTKYLKLKPVAYSDWKSGKSKSYRKYLIEIAEYFGVSIDYLVYGKEHNSPSQKLSNDELELLSYYKKLNEREKGIVFGEAKVLSELRSGSLNELSSNSPKVLNNKEKKTVKIDIFTLPVSAGVGVYLDSNDKEEIEVERSYMTEEADFALRVSGDSMEPMYYSGDIILIRSQRTVELGEIGVFVLNGAGFVKKLGRDRLISLNKKYDDILFSENDSIYCMGKVLGGYNE